MNRHEELLNRITTSPEILVGKPTVRGMRISVEQILHMLAAGRTGENILKEFPELEKDDIPACLEYAAQAVEMEKVFKVPA
jgi:uncharacterized protein (DUF433 family)